MLLKLIFTLIFATFLLHFGYAQSSSGTNCKIAEDYCPNPDIEFYVYSRNDPITGTELNLGNCTQLKQQLRECIGKRIYILIHGNMGDHNDQFNSKGRNVCLDAGDNCVISVDWSALTPTNCFNQSARNTPVVGNCTANLIVTIMSCTSISSDQFNVKGFSFGARICEWVAQRLKPNGIKLERMTKIEPSKRFPGDSFVPQDSSSQQNSTDAKWVDCHHTASGFRSQIEPCGHADCYWNNGQSQPICAGLDNNAFYDHACSHVVGYEYYWSSYNYPFLGRKCEYDDGLPLENCTTETVRAGWFMPNGTVGQYNVSTALMPQNLINQMNRTVLC